MEVIKDFIHEFRNTYTIDDKLIMIFAISLFLPFPITVIAIVGIGLYVLIKSDFRHTLKTVKRSYCLLLFAIYLFVVSFISGNILGVWLSVGMFFLFVVIIYYRKYISKELFEKIVDVMLVMSVLCVFVAIIEQAYYALTYDKMNGFFDIQDNPEYRVHVVFFNANYYAMMLVFVEALCLYKIMINPVMKKRIYYSVVAILNIFAIYLTGGRVVWVSLGLSILLMLLMNKWFKTFVVSCGGILGMVGVLFIHPEIIPRLAQHGVELDRRSQIYEAARLMMRDMWKFGEGPLSYYYRYEDYYPLYVETYGSEQLNHLGIATTHAHSMFLEPFISFGVVGTFIVGWYLLSQVRRAIRLLTRDIDIALGTLIIGFVIITISFCIVDFPIFWVQTGGLFLLILASSDVYKKEVEEEK